MFIAGSHVDRGRIAARVVVLSWVGATSRVHHLVPSESVHLVRTPHIRLQPAVPKRKAFQTGPDAGQAVRPREVRCHTDYRGFGARPEGELPRRASASKRELVASAELIISEEPVWSRLAACVEGQALPEPDAIRARCDLPSLIFPCDLGLGHFEADALGLHTEPVSQRVPTRPPNAIASQSAKDTSVQVAWASYARLDRGGGRQSVVSASPSSLCADETIHAVFGRGDRADRDEGSKRIGHLRAENAGSGQVAQRMDRLRLSAVYEDPIDIGVVEIREEIEPLAARSIQLHPSLLKEQQRVERPLRDLIGEQQLVELFLGLDVDEYLVSNGPGASRREDRHAHDEQRPP